MLGFKLLGYSFFFSFTDIKFQKYFGIKGYDTLKCMICSVCGWGKVQGKEAVTV
jgi:hypothetical protein